MKVSKTYFKKLVLEELAATVNEPWPEIADSKSMTNAHNQEEARHHRTELHNMAENIQKLLQLTEDEDDFPEWVDSKIAVAAESIQTIFNYFKGNDARDSGSLK